MLSMASLNPAILYGTNPIILPDLEGVEVARLATTTFRDGETHVKVEHGEMAGRHIFLNQSTGKSASTEKSVNENLVQLLFSARTAKRWGARELTAVVPYFAYARQDHVMGKGEALTAQDVAFFMEASGIDRVVSIDLHSEKISQFFSTARVVNLSAAEVFAQHLSQMSMERPVVVAPDKGARDRAALLKFHLEQLGIETPPVEHIEKTRIRAGEVESMTVTGALDLKGRSIVVFDDICDSAGTLSKAVEKMQDLGAEKVIACITHPVLSDPAYERLSQLRNFQLITTDTIDVDARFKALETVTQISMGPLLGEVVSRLATGGDIEAYTLHSVCEASKSKANDVRVPSPASSTDGSYVDLQAEILQENR
jgi:ribose-phosphate pyrophosphokinase